MKLKYLVFVFGCLMLASCSGLLVEENSSASVSKGKQKQEQARKKIITVEVKGFSYLLQALSNDALRMEGQKKLAALKIKYANTKQLPLTSIDLMFKSLIEDFPLQQHDQLMLDLSKKYEDVFAKDMALKTLDNLIVLYPQVNFLDEIQFRRGNILYELRQYLKAEQAYKLVIDYRNSAYYEQAVYQQGWSQFKQTHYHLALNSFMHLLDVHSRDGDLVFKSMSAEEKQFIDDVVRSINLSFDSLAGPVSARNYFSKKQKRKYEYHVFVSLADFYQQRNSISDAVKTYQLFVSLNEQHIKSPIFLLKIMRMYKEAGFDDAFLDAQKDFVLRYSASHVYWRLHPKSKTRKSFNELKKNIEQLANRYYFLAKHSNKASDYRQAQRWCRLYLLSFPDAVNAWSIRQQMAESLQLNQLYELAALEYERIAYDYKKRSGSSRAAYSALLMYEKRLAELSGFEKKYWYKLLMDSAQRFVTIFPEHAKASSIRSGIINNMYVNGEYDKAFSFFGAREWQNAADAFESFREVNAQQKLQSEVTKKLAQVYLELGDLKKAITEYQQVSFLSDVGNHQIDALWLAAELAEVVSDKQAIKIYTRFISRFPFPLQRSMEARQRLIEVLERSGDSIQAAQWRVQLVNADAKGGGFRTDRSRYLAAKSRLKLAQPLEERYRNASLYAPLSESLKIKKDLMNEVVSAYKMAASYKVPEVLTAATYRIAEINMNLSEAIIHSEMPAGFNENKQKQYDVLLNKKAQPYKDKAIYFYEVNVSRLKDGLDDGWVRKSIERLGEVR